MCELIAEGKRGFVVGMEVVFRVSICWCWTTLNAYNSFPSLSPRNPPRFRSTERESAGCCRTQRHHLMSVAREGAGGLALEAMGCCEFDSSSNIASELRVIAICTCSKTLKDRYFDLVCTFRNSCRIQGITISRKMTCFSPCHPPLARPQTVATNPTASSISHLLDYVPGLLEGYFSPTGGV